LPRWQPPCIVDCALTLPVGIPAIRPVAAGEPDTAERHADTVFTTLGDNPEAAGADATALLLRSPHIAIDATNLPPTTAAQIAAGALLRAWRYDHLRTQPDTENERPRLTRITLAGDPATHAAWRAIAPGITGTLFARDLTTEPSNTLTPQGFLDRLVPLREAGVTLEILAPDQLAAQNFGGLLAVGRGSIHPPCLAILRWAGQGAPVAFVGKGITFDTGGISIKPADQMWDMRADMAGAAACAGAIYALALRQSPRAAIAILALAENTTGAASYRPGDILHMHNGTTVAVVDTDAEGRLVLADAISYAETLNPAAIIDLATLTGSIVTALGHERAGAFGTHETLTAAAQKAGDAVGEPIWPMPLHDAYAKPLESDIADIRHCVDARGQPDSCQAAIFLRGFVTNTPWLHLDIAGVENHAESTARHPDGASGFGARLLDRLMSDHFEAEPNHG
jgi:leucyl aminopeptidase